jgi:hypothetical protein
MKTIVALGLGIVIGAGGMWFMQKSSEKTLQVDEVIETYSTPMTGDNQPIPDNTAPESKPTTTGSLDNQLNLSDASHTSNGMGNIDNGMNNNTNNSMNNGINNDMNNERNQANIAADNAQNSVNNSTSHSTSTENLPSQGGY